MKYIATIDEQEFIIDINDDGHIQIDGETYNVDLSGLDGTQLYSLVVDGQSYDLDVEEGDEDYIVMIKGILYEVMVQDERTRRLAGVRGAGGITGEVNIKAPMPGVVVNVLVSEGEEVSKGSVLVILESMKMQNEFKAPKDGTVNHIRVAVGDKIDQNAVMITLS